MRTDKAIAECLYDGGMRHEPPLKQIYRFMSCNALGQLLP